MFKLDKHVTNAEDRYLMTVIATASNPKFTVSRVDTAWIHVVATNKTNKLIKGDDDVDEFMADVKHNASAVFQDETIDRSGGHADNQEAEEGLR